MKLAGDDEKDMLIPVIAALILSHSAISMGRARTMRDLRAIMIS
jgi:hypothetical protein